MGSTTNKGLPWPTPTVGVKPNVAQDIRNLAETTDLRMSASTNVGSGQDMNTYSLPGMYYGFGWGDAPNGDSATYYLTVLNSDSAGAAVMQMAHKIAAGDFPWWFRTRAGGTWTTWAKIATVNDTGWMLAPISPASGWGSLADPKGHSSSPLKGGVRNLNGSVEYRFQMTRTGAAITASASGNIGGDPVIATVNPAVWPGLVPSSIVDDAFDIIGVQAGVARIDDAGQITISALYPNDAINTNDVIQVSLRFLAG